MCERTLLLLLCCLAISQCVVWHLYFLCRSFPRTSTIESVPPLNRDVGSVHAQGLRDVKVKLGVAPMNLKHTSSVHVLMALSGNAEGVLAEWEVALKSVLLNAPTASLLHIHILVDDLAEHAVGSKLNQTMLNHSKWPTSIQISVYNVETRIAAWRAEVQRVSGHVSDLHTFGTYYRLFAHTVLEKTSDVTHVLYMDTDVVVLQNLDALWQHELRNQDRMFVWGDSQCAGFLILNLERMVEFWETFPKLNNSGITNWGSDDQVLLRLAARERPEWFGRLPPEWDIHMADGAWRYAPRLVEERPNAGMLHFNGGGGSKEAYFKTQNNPTSKYEGWNVVLYYVNLPWSWVRSIAASRCVGTKCSGMVIR